MDYSVKRKVQFNLVFQTSRCDEDDSGEANWAMMVFLCAQLLHGAGATPLFTLGVTYIDENVSKKMSSVYLGKN